ncbi:hypothetical protein BGP_0869 [Beggiatoa sp. PS]|nr:hypothetical protein BGP_0869 [Beggiatoa sp. PS]
MGKQAVRFLILINILAARLPTILATKYLKICASVLNYYQKLEHQVTDFMGVTSI